MIMKAMMAIDKAMTGIITPDAFVAYYGKVMGGVDIESFEKGIERFMVAAAEIMSQKQGGGKEVKETDELEELLGLQVSCICRHHPLTRHLSGLRFSHVATGGL